MPRRPRRHSDARLAREARLRFGITAFKPGQRELLDATLAGRDVLGILPTGGGKSLCFQLPALLEARPTVVVSPLIALMRDQEAQLEARDVVAARLDSTLRAGEEREALAAVADGAAELVYCTPERLENPEQLALLREAGVARLVVDEAHCVSQWGHDFRPAYLSLRDARAALGDPPILALTATATPEVEADVVRQLGLRDPVVVRISIDRPNLGLAVERCVNEERKRAALLRLLGEEPGLCLVYVATVRTAEELTTWLASEGIPAVRYHGRLPARERSEIQEGFLAGSHRVVVATKAFGLGIDKPDIRLVVHHQFPDSLESYFQECGRAGRDGEPARAVLLYRLEDRRIQSYFLGGRYPSRAESLAIHDAIRALAAEADGRGVRVDAIAARAGASLRRVRVVVAQLTGAGVLERCRRLHLRRNFADSNELDAFLGAYEERHTDDRRRLDAMMRYAQSTRCRAQQLRAYFGADEGEACGRCDNCRGDDGVAGSAPAAATAA